MMNQATYSLPPTYTRDEIAGPKTIKKQMLRNEHICISLITLRVRRFGCGGANDGEIGDPGAVDGCG